MTAHTQARALHRHPPGRVAGQHLGPRHQRGRPDQHPPPPPLPPAPAGRDPPDRARRADHKGGLSARGCTHRAWAAAAVCGPWPTACGLWPVVTPLLDARITKVGCLRAAARTERGRRLRAAARTGHGRAAAAVCGPWPVVWCRPGPV